MDWSRSTPLGAIKQRLDWLDQRQQVLARNIANADTPGFRPSDLAPLQLQDRVRHPTVVLATTGPAHLPGTAPASQPYQVRRDAAPAEALPDGNAVDLEEQMAKVAETGASHRLATELYRKYLGMFRAVAGARQ